MFHGSLPASALQIQASIVKEWEVTDIYIGCSGNFTCERMLQNVTDARLHSNDVTIYSCLLGAYFSGKPLDVKFKESYDGPMAFVRDYMKTDADTITVMLLLSKMGTYLASKPNPFYEKMIEAYKGQWDRLFNETKAKVEKIGPFIADFFAGDVCQWIDMIPKEAGFICYPPFYSGDYEKMFTAIEGVFDWTPPEYEMIDKDRIFDLFRKMTERDHFIFGTNDNLPEFRQYLAGMTQTTNRGVPLYLYAKASKSRIVMPDQNVKSLAVPHIGADEDVGGTMTIMPLKSENFHALRSQYMSRYIKPGSETAAYGVLVDGKLIGVFAFSASPTLANWDTHIATPTMYLLSDFPVTPTKYKRLAKLVLYAALSKESKLLAERLTNKRIRSLVTTAFTKRQMSMKYRGLFDLLNKKKLPGVEEGETDLSKRYYNEGYQLNYGAAMGQWTLQEGLALWKKKHSQTGRGAEE